MIVRIIFFLLNLQDWLNENKIKINKSNKCFLSKILNGFEYSMGTAVRKHLAIYMFFFYNFEIKSHLSRDIII